jgi:anti-anti-sigma factor
MPDLRILSPAHDLVVSARDAKSVRIVAVAGEADLQTEHRLSRALRDTLPKVGAALVLDLTGLSFCSAYAMGVLVDMVGSTAHRGVNIAVVGLPPITARVWLLTDIPIPVQYATVDLAVAALTIQPVHSVPAQPDSEPGTTRLLAELDGLRRALSTRAVIEQAKGMIMERIGCTSQTAFDLLVQQSQRTDRKVLDLAADEIRSSEVTAALRVGRPEDDARGDDQLTHGADPDSAA